MIKFLTEQKKYTLLYALIFSLGAFFAGHALADTIDQYQVNGTYDYPSGYSNWTPVQTFKPDVATTHLSKVQLYMEKQSNIMDLHAYLCRMNSATSTPTRYCGGGTQVALLDRTSAFNALTNGAWQWFDFPFNVDVNPAYTYAIELDGQSSPANYIHVKVNSATDDYIYGKSTKLDGSTLNYDLNFITFQSVANISINTPLQGETYKDFPNWQIFYNVASSTASSTCDLFMQYGNNPSGFPYADHEVVPCYQNVNWALAKIMNLPDGYWYSQASIYVDGIAYASSSIVSFFIDNASGTDNYIGGNSNTIQIKNQYINPCADVDTTTWYGGLLCGLKKFAVWAFTPNAITGQELVNAKNEAKGKLPWSIYFDIPEALDTAIASSSSSTNQTIDMPVYTWAGASSTVVGVPVISSSTMVNAIGQTNTDTYRLYLGYVIDLFFVALTIFITYLFFFRRS